MIIRLEFWGRYRCPSSGGSLIAGLLRGPRAPLRFASRSCGAFYLFAEACISERLVLVERQS